MTLSSGSPNALLDLRPTGRRRDTGAAVLRDDGGGPGTRWADAHASNGQSCSARARSPRKRRSLGIDGASLATSSTMSSPVTHSRSFDALVIGLGGIGSSVCLELTRRQMRVAGIEQHDFGHDRGSSHGDTRLFRARHQFHHRARLAAQACELWRRLESDSGRSLMTSTGLVVVPKEPPPPDLGLLELHEADLRELGLRGPGEEQRAWYDPTGAVLAVEDCVRAQCRVAAEYGASLWNHTRVLDVTRCGDGFEVLTDRGPLWAHQVVVAMGAWSAAACESAGLQPYRVPQVWYAPRVAAPIPFVYDLPQGDFYGAGWGPGPVKVGGPRHARLADPEARGDAVDASVVSQIDAFVRRCVPSLRPGAVSSKWCMSTASPDEEFIVDRSTQGIVVAAGFSGHGFKYAPAVAVLVAELVMGNSTPDHAAFSYERFGRGPLHVAFHGGNRGRVAAR